MTTSSPRKRTLIAPTPIVLDHLLASFERHLKAERRRPDTITPYLRTARRFHAYAEEQGMPPLTGMRREHVEAWLAEAADKGLSTHTQHSYYTWLRQWFRWLAEEGEIDVNPMANMRAPATDETDKDIAETKELEGTLERLEKAKNYRDAAVVALVYDTGMRRGEVARLPIEDIDMERGLVRLKGAGTKGRFARTLAISPRCVRYLDRYFRKRPVSPWFLPGQKAGTHVHPQSVYRIIVTAFAWSGRTISPHDLRHTSATHVSAEMSETDMMALFGWSHADMARHYSKGARTTNAIAAHRRASPLERLK